MMDRTVKADPQTSISAASPKPAVRKKAPAKSRAKAPAKAKRLDVQKTYKLYIGGKFPRTESGRYFLVKDAGGGVANICLASRKDFREAVVAARSAFGAWNKASAYLRSQILYRIAEMLEGRTPQFIAELTAMGATKAGAEQEVAAAIDCLVYYAGWADKYQQIFSAVNPVASSHFNFSMMEPVGVVAIVAPAQKPLLGLVSDIASTMAGGNTLITLASEKNPLPAISFAEALHTSDVPAGAVNILTGHRNELLEQFASHMDVNAIVYNGDAAGEMKLVQEQAANNIKRVIIRKKPAKPDPYQITDLQETKTTWHPIGG